MKYKVWSNKGIVIIYSGDEWDVIGFFTVADITCVKIVVTNSISTLVTFKNGSEYSLIGNVISELLEAIYTENTK